MTVLRRGRRLGAALSALGLALLGFPMAAWAQDAGAGISGFNLDADANGVGVTFGAPHNQPYPTAAGLVPFAKTTLGDASAYALGSLSWPGPLAANAGDLANVLLPACFPDGDGVCTPGPGELPPGARESANSPIRAEARSSGPNEVTSPGMSARAYGDEAAAEAEVQQATTPGAFTVGTINATSRSVLEDDKAVAVGRATISGINVAGRIVIESVVSEARAETDGADPATSGRTVVHGLVIDGHPASIDENGITFGDQQNDNPLSEFESGFNEGFAEGGFEMFVTRPVAIREGEVVSYRTGALVIAWNIPDSGGQLVVVSIGGASATAQASPGFLESLSDGDDLSFGDEVSPLVLGEAGTGLDPLPFSGGGGGGTGAPLPQAVSPEGAPLVALDLAPASFFDGISPASVVLALLGAGLLFAGLRRLGAAALDRPPATCPLEGRPS